MSWLPIRYVRALTPGRVALWCYLIWYLVTVAFCFDPSPSLWLNSLGISAVVGAGLVLSISARDRGRSDRWQIARLFLMPFCVSSFSSLIKERGYVLIFPSRPAVLATSIGACAAFVLLVAGIKRFGREAPGTGNRGVG
jgi:hypothetical protein